MQRPSGRLMPDVLKKAKGSVSRVRKDEEGDDIRSLGSGWEPAVLGK